MVKKKAVIITIYDPNPNMGNRLQNYAVQTILEKMGFDTISIMFRKPTMNFKRNIKYCIHKLTGFKFTKNKIFWNTIPQQIKVFNKFNRKYIKSFRINKLDDIPPADFYILGSDQIWNPQWWADDQPDIAQNLYFATFSNPEKIICLSPSFGVESIPEQWESWFKQCLSRISKLSVRENAGKKLIKKLSGKEAIVTIDPTLMLDKDEWEKIVANPPKINIASNYILVYFLGTRSAKANLDIEKYEKELDATVYYLFDKNNRELLWAGPSDFIYLVAHAQLILTDSFHACVFSFIYGKPFLVYNRTDNNNMMSRMDTFLDTFDLRRKYVYSYLPNDILECDYSIGYKSLKMEQKKLNDFLKASLGANSYEVFE